MDVISNLGLGFAIALTIQNTAYCFIGVLLGTIIGVLPGIGPVTTVAMLLPISFTLQPESALILLAGIYYGAQYGGSTTAIVVLGLPPRLAGTALNSGACRFNFSSTGLAHGREFLALRIATYPIWAIS